jgi:hypothetical protein
MIDEKTKYFPKRSDKSPHLASSSQGKNKQKQVKKGQLRGHRIRIYMSIMMILILIIGNTLLVSARNFKGSDKWLVDFDGTKMNSNFTSSSINDETANIQPGDSIELKVQIKNSGKEKTDWYMTNEIIKTLEDAKITASGGVYEYRLSYIGNSNTETILYDSTTVGGEDTSQNQIGLHQATDSLEDYFYLDRLSTGQNGWVRLWLKVEGETQGNGYQQTLASLQMNYAVEKVPEGTTRTVVRRVTGDRVIQTAVRSPVKTSDDSDILFFSVILLISGLFLLIIGCYSLMKRKDNTKKGA